MSLGAILAFLVVLVVVFLWGNLWFHLVEGLLGRLRCLLPDRRPPSGWHPYPTEEAPEEQRADDGP